jgi:hypothetical protein
VYQFSIAACIRLHPLLTQDRLQSSLKAFTPQTSAVCQNQTSKCYLLPNWKFENMKILELKSPKDGSLLSFEIRGRDQYETCFNVSVKRLDFSGTVPASTYMVGAPSTLFQEMAGQWNGWPGEKVWADLEGRVTITATTDNTGHVSLRVVLYDQDYDSRLSVTWECEAGQLERMAADIADFFGWALQESPLGYEIEMQPSDLFKIDAGDARLASIATGG